MIATAGNCPARCCSPASSVRATRFVPRTRYAAWTENRPLRLTAER